MVASLSSLSSSAQAAIYYEADDYYAEGGGAPSAWLGSGANGLGLEGEVDPHQFRTLLEGVLPDGATLGTHRDGERQHRPGWDLTFSAPKSVSVMALVAGDRRLIQAHTEAVTSALAFAERHAAGARIRNDGTVVYAQTRNFTAATFRHETSRAQDPQLHTHAVILNMTRDAEGGWRSLDSRALYQLQKSIGEVYRQELAMGARRLGYEILAGKESMFELRDVPAEVSKIFSERAAQVEARLAERGQNRATASAEEKQIAALDTRAAKLQVERGALLEGWRAEADAAGFDQQARQAMVRAAEEQAQRAGRNLLLTGEAEALAHNAVRFAAEKLGERQAVFSAVDLEREAGRNGLGRLDHASIVQAVIRQNEGGQLSERTFRSNGGVERDGYSTAVAIAHEERLLRNEQSGRGVSPSIVTALQAARIVVSADLRARDEGRGWSDEQRRATTSVLNSRNRIVAVQGYAGTAKTTTVLATVAKAAADRGFDVRALAPSASAALTLGEALDLEGHTVARHLLNEGGQARAGARRQLWIVDEASLVSAKDMDRLLESARLREAKIVLVGDIKQLGSVGAGAAFRQLQEAGMETLHLTSIVRQTNPLTLEAVEASIVGNARRALEALDRGGGRVREAASVEERRAAISAEYVRMSVQKRRRTLVIDPSREGREELTRQIRQDLIKAGELGAKAVLVQTLSSKDLTKAEAKLASAYDVGDVVTFAKTLHAKGVEKGAAYLVSKVDTENRVVTLASSDGREIAWVPHRWGQVSAYQIVERELRAGDRVEFTRNDGMTGRVNGLGGEVLGVDAQARTAVIRTDKGRSQNLSLDALQDRHLRHGYVQTAFAAQGRTADRVLIHAESHRANLIDQSAFYVVISRARVSAQVFTDDRARLVGGIESRAGMKSMALDGVIAGKATISAKFEAGL